MSIIQRENQVLTVTMANGATESAAFDVSRFSYGAVIMPAAFDGASLAFKISSTSGGTFAQLYSGVSHALNGDWTVPVFGAPTAGRAYDISGVVALATWVKLLAGSTQTADRTFTIILKS